MLDDISSELPNNTTRKEAPIKREDLFFYDAVWNLSISLGKQLSDIQFANFTSEFENLLEEEKKVFNNNWWWFDIEKWMDAVREYRKKNHTI